MNPLHQTYVEPMRRNPDYAATSNSGEGCAPDDVYEEPVRINPASTEVGANRATLDGENYVSLSSQSDASVYARPEVQIGLGHVALDRDNYVSSPPQFDARRGDPTVRNSKYDTNA
jgi:hypothetical protein